MSSPASHQHTPPVPSADGGPVRAGLPPARTAADALARIRAHNAATRAWLVVLDDDPTGSQAMHDVLVLLDPDPADLTAAARERRVTFIWTNTRSLPEVPAAEMNRTLVRAAIEAGARAGVRPVFVSRSDSTLRGHFAAEIMAISSTCGAAGQGVDGVVFAPAFLEAGRYTANDVQWVAQPDGATVPVTDTEFARDATFGYHETNLRAWVTARTRLPPGRARSIPLGALRTHGPAAAEQVLSSLRGGDIVIGNATDAADLEALALACQAAERAGRRLLYRTGPSFVRALAGQPRRGPLTRADLAASTVHGRHGLTVVGSHTTLTTRQLDAAGHAHQLTVLEVDVESLLDDHKRHETRRRAVDHLVDTLPRRDTVLATSRSVRTVAGDRQASLAIARRVSGELCAIVAALPPSLPLRYVIAKGGITSHEIAARGLGMRQATVLGQLFPGQVSVLRLGQETDRPGMPYVVFPGNVGTVASLAQVLSTVIGTR
jgi:uncharacterized protein YgbK (DUF1537 family)